MRFFRIDILCLTAVLLSGCGSFRPEPSRAKFEPVLRGWSFVESSEEMADQQTGAPAINYSSPVLYKDELLVATERFGLTSFNKHSGTVNWRIPIKGGASSTPVVFENKVFVGSNEGFFFAYPLGGGAEHWSQDLRFPVKGKPAYLGGRILVATVDHAMHALDASTGKILWTYRRNAASGTTIKGGGNASVIDGKFWVGFSDGSLVVLEPNDGSELREKQFRDNIKFTDIDAEPVPWKQGVLVSTYDGRLRYIKKNGLPIWTFPKGSAKAAVPGSGVNMIFLPGSDGTVYAVSDSSGKRIWQYSLERGVPTGVAYFGNSTDASMKDGLVAVASSDNFLYILDAKTGSLKQIMRFGSSSGAYGSVIADQKNKRFYVLSHYGRVYQFRVR